MPLIVVQDDAEYVLVRRRGRFDIEWECVRSAPHFGAAIAEAQKMMIKGLRKVGYEWYGDGFEIRGPEPHMIYSTHVEADPGPANRPHPLDIEGNKRFEAAERARMSRKASTQTSNVELVDFILVTKFKRRVPKSMRTLPHSVQPNRARSQRAHRQDAHALGNQTIGETAPVLYTSRGDTIKVGS